VKAEREHQTQKWGSIQDHPQSIPGYLLIMRKELEEAEQGWMKNAHGRSSVLSEILQVVATGVACLEQHAPMPVENLVLDQEEDS